MKHHPLYLIVNRTESILHRTKNKPLDDLLIRAFTHRDLAPVQGYVEERPRVVEAWETRINVDCGVLGERSAAIVYVRHQLPWGEPDVCIWEASIDGCRVIMHIDHVKALEMQIEDDLIAAEENEPKDGVIGDRRFSRGAA
jgi:glycerol-3-phosphate cytidylyltransferase-like family protein